MISEARVVYIMHLISILSSPTFSVLQFLCSFAQRMELLIDFIIIYFVQQNFCFNEVLARAHSLS